MIRAVREWFYCLVGVALAAVSIPLVYWIGREKLFPQVDDLAFLRLFTLFLFMPVQLMVISLAVRALSKFSEEYEGVLTSIVSDVVTVAICVLLIWLGTSTPVKVSQDLKDGGTSIHTIYPEIAPEQPLHEITIGR